MKYRVIYETENEEYRILEYVDEFADLEDLKGESFCHKVNPDIDAAELKRQEREFEDEVQREGAYGYVLERWNPAPGIGYEHVDSCWGFVGAYSETEERYRHYIVDEMKQTIEADSKESKRGAK